MSVTACSIIHSCLEIFNSIVGRWEVGKVNELCKVEKLSTQADRSELKMALDREIHGLSKVDIYIVTYKKEVRNSAITKTIIFNCFPIMSLTCTNTTRCCARLIIRHSLRPTSLAPSAISQRQRRRPTQRWASTESTMSPKISGIVDQISQLTLLETADLGSSLKVCYAGCQPVPRKCQ